MKSFIRSIQNKSEDIYKEILNDEKLCSDLCQSNTHLPIPFSKADSPSEIKLVIIGQDPTVRAAETRKNITTVLMLNESKQLFNFISLIIHEIGINIEEIYATNLYKCFFKNPPQDDERILTRHFRYWIDLLIGELNNFPNAKIITLGQPILKQLVHSGEKQVKYYWDYTGASTSGGDFKSISANQNFLQRTLYPLPHLPTYNQNKFYKTYFTDYLHFI